MRIRILFIILFLLSRTAFAQVTYFLEDGDGSGATVHAHKFSTFNRDDHVGALVLTTPFRNFQPEFHPFLNDTFGTAMNQDVTFGGTPEIIHNGGSSTEWTATAIAGVWNFADAGKITITSANNNDKAEFAEETPTTIDMSGFTALTGKVDLDIYNGVNNSMVVEFDLAGVAVGNTIDLNDFINTGDFTEQSFVIPKADLGLTTQSLDGMSIVILRIGGSKPTIKFDDIQLEATSGSTSDPIVFKATTPQGSRLHISELRVRIEDNIASTLADGTLLGLDPTTFLGVSALSNGLVFTSVKNGKTLFSVTIKDLGDFLATGSNIINAVSLNGNTLITLLIEFPEPIVLEGGESENFLSFTVNDNLSGLVAFTAAARGALEIE